MTCLLTLLLSLAPSAVSAQSAQARLKVTWPSALPVPEGAVIKLEVFNDASSARLITSFWRAVVAEDRALEIPLPGREELDPLMRRAETCSFVAPSTARVAFVVLGVWVGAARIGDLELFDGQVRVLLGFADVDAAANPSACKRLNTPVIAAGWNLVRLDKERLSKSGEGAIRPLMSGSLTARYVSALPRPRR